MIGKGAVKVLVCQVEDVKGCKLELKEDISSTKEEGV